MDSNVHQTAIAETTVRTPDCLASTSAPGLTVPAPALGVAMPAAPVRARATYAAGSAVRCGAPTTTTTDQGVLVLRDWDADRKFSTRLGPPASPPV